ncbi:MAG: HDIG domain-containing protein [Anaerolineae bacterium]|nr:HDIG domain-containing protein [Anaerolineae bacterium]
MARALRRWSDTWLSRPNWATPQMLRNLNVVALALLFVLLVTVILSLDTIFPAGNQTADLRIGSVVDEDIRAPRSLTYVSRALTERARQAAVEAVAPIYDPPDPTVARQQLDLTRAILTYITNVRQDPYGTRSQKVGDLKMIAAFDLPEVLLQRIIEIDEDAWHAIEGEIINVLERVMREPIREPDLVSVRDQLPMQVSVRFDSRQADIIVAILEDTVRPNQFENPDATETARQEAANATEDETRSFAQGQVIVRAGTRIDEIDYETLQAFGLLQPQDLGGQILLRSLLASLTILLSGGLYIMRFQPVLRRDFQMLALLVTLFLIALLGAKIFAGSGQFYLYPAAAVALLFVSFVPVEVAIIGGLSLALLYGIITGGSLEAMSLAGFGSLVGAASLRRAERVNTFFIAGLMISFVNLLVVVMFNIDALSNGESGRLGVFVLFSVINGIFAAAVALAGMYVVTLGFNLPTSLKLVELSQPNQALLQRLLREAPGTYQHSLQVANLSEQAALALGANAQLVRVAALYHDIGKMLNPAFFIENQAEGVNPHDQLNDPVRSAAIILSHVPDGDRLAKQYRLPARIRDFILEHHGTTGVGYFYKQALDQAEEPDTVDIEQFRYPGPRPRSRETAILMLADSCESTVRARKPTTRQQIADIVDEMVDIRLRDGQMDDADLTTRDLKTIRTIFVEMLQAVFHPRINYPTLPSSRRPGIETPPAGRSVVDDRSEPEPVPEVQAVPNAPPDDTPLPDVPPLRRVAKSTQETKAVNINSDKDSEHSPSEMEQGGNGT